MEKGVISGAGFKTYWEAGNLSGSYKFKAKVSKEFDGRKFEVEKTANPHLSLNYVNTEVIDTLAYKWKIPDTDIHYPFNKYMSQNSINTMNYLLYEFLYNYIWTQEGREGVRFKLVSANLYKGGFFDEPTSNTPSPWLRLHTMHRMGYNIDISKDLTDDKEFDDDPICNKEYKKIFSKWFQEKTKGKSFCQWHKYRRPHWHCNIK